jgi:hypothetical protein
MIHIDFAQPSGESELPALGMYDKVETVSPHAAKGL